MATKMLPDTTVVPQVGPMKLAGGFVWGVTFTLASSAPRNGHIFQEISQSQGGPLSPVQTLRYMEAWPVKRGDTVTARIRSLRQVLTTGTGAPTSGDPTLDRPCNDFFIRRFVVGDQGFMLYQAVAAFYDEPLPSGFITSNPATGAGPLPSRVISTAHPVPTFWDGTGLFRMLQFTFDFSTSTSTANATLETVTISPGRIGTKPAPSQWKSWP